MHRCANKIRWLLGNLPEINQKCCNSQLLHATMRQLLNFFQLASFLLGKFQRIRRAFFPGLVLKKTFLLEKSLRLLSDLLFPIPAGIFVFLRLIKCGGIF